MMIVHSEREINGDGVAIDDVAMERSISPEESNSMAVL